MSTNDSQLPGGPTSLIDSMGDPDPQTFIGQVIDGRYRVLEFVGQGGMGNVYRGEHVTIRRPVALKLLHRSLAGVPEILRRFEREAYAIGRISHPNCVTVSDFGKLDDGTLFLVMEFLEGQSLADMLDEEVRLRPDRALWITRHICAGLGHAHRAGIVHRDIKPENVFIVERDGDVDFAKILDFGIAKLVGAAEPEGSEKLTQAGMAFGTPCYISPEQAVGDPADPRSDLYSATVILFQLLTGRPPFYSEDKLEMMAQHVSKPPPTVSEVNGEPVAEAVEALVAKGLAKRPKDRFESASAFVDAIDEYLEPIMRSRPTSHADAPNYVLPARTTPARGVAADSPPTAFSASSDPDPGQSLRSGGGGKKWLFALIAVAAAAFYFLVIDRVDLDTQGAYNEVMAERSPVASAADKKLDEGAPDEVIEMVKESDTEQSDAKGQLSLGHAHATKSEYNEAVQAYERALEIDPELISDDTLTANLKLMVDTSGEVFLDALELQIKYKGDDAARDRLVALASTKSRTLRRRAIDLAETLGLGDRIDRVQAFMYELHQADSCKERREYVSKLRSLADKRAIEALDKAAVRHGKGRWKKKNINDCLRRQALDAIRFLKALPDPKPVDPGVN